jgi:flagellar protein FlgJ
MKPSEFVKKLYPYAKAVQDKNGISAVAILAQAACESAWGAVAPGNMYFGIKDTDGVNGNEQLLVTTEYLASPNYTFPQVLKVVKVGVNRWKYTVKDWFRKYPTPEASFADHAKFFFQNKRYNKALLYRDNAYSFIDEIAAAGYATGPEYATTLKTIARMIEKEIKAQKL